MWRSVFVVQVVFVDGCFDCSGNGIGAKQRFQCIARVRFVFDGAIECVYGSVEDGAEHRRINLFGEFVLRFQPCDRCKVEA